jgi:hypothetical protein
MNDESKFLAFTLKGKGGPDIYAAFNAHSFKVRGGADIYAAFNAHSFKVRYTGGQQD